MSKTSNRIQKYLKQTLYTKWSFHMHLQRMYESIRVMKPAVDTKSPVFNSRFSMNKKRARLDEARVKRIERQNLALLERLRQVHNREFSDFCHIKVGKPLMRGDAYRLKPQAGTTALLRQYKKMKIGNPAVMRKSLRVQQEMLTSAMETVKAVKLYKEVAARLREDGSDDLLDGVTSLSLQPEREGSMTH